MGVEDFYTIPQQITLVTISLLSGSVSLLASLTIIFIIWRDRQKKLKVVYHRILFAMSIVDAVASSNFAWSFLAVPRGMFWGAQGNTASCEASGFLHTLFVSQGLYSCGLAVYYLMIVRYGKSQEFVSRFIEPYVHTLSLCIPMGVTLWALLSEVMNPLLFLGGWCFMAPYPHWCSKDGTDTGTVACSRGSMAKVISNVMLIVVMVPPIIGIVSAMIMIMCHVRGRLAAVVRYRTRPRLNDTARQTVFQSLLYIGASLIPFILLTVHEVLTYVKNDQQITRFVVSLLVKLIVPLQGLFNLIIYVRPRYIALRQRRGDSLSFFKIMKYIVVGEAPLSQPEDRVDDLAPELTVPCSFRWSAPVHSHDTIKEEDWQSQTPNVDVVSVDSNEGLPESSHLDIET